MPSVDRPIGRDIEMMGGETDARTSERLERLGPSAVMWALSLKLNCYVPVPDVQGGAATLAALPEFTRALEATSLSSLRRRASTDPEATIELGLRLLTGIGCAHQPAAACETWSQIGSVPGVTDEQVARAFILLGAQLLLGDVPPGQQHPAEAISLTQVKTSAMALNEAAKLGYGTAPHVLFHGQRLVAMCAADPMVKRECAPFMAHVVRALELREREMAREERKVDRRREARPLRYICANPACRVQSTRSRLFAQCAGPCADVRPLTETVRG